MKIRPIPAGNEAAHVNLQETTKEVLVAVTLLAIHTENFVRISCRYMLPTYEAIHLCFFTNYSYYTNYGYYK
jgi:hypothetical protein